MSWSFYSPINSFIEFISFLDEGDTISLKKSNDIAIEKSRAKSYLDSIDLLAILASIASLIISIYAITSNWSLSWRLGFEGQIIVINFLLSIMTLCMRRVASTLFLILEARWGDSRLQNYEALLRISVTLSHVRHIWRAILLFLLLLPLGLSVAYKRFSDEHLIVSFIDRYFEYYGLTSSPMGNYHVIHNYSPYLAINAIVPFVKASSNDNITLPLSPKTYDFNTLFIDNTSITLLDILVSKYVFSIQQNLINQES